MNKHLTIGIAMTLSALGSTLLSGQTPPPASSEKSTIPENKASSEISDELLVLSPFTVTTDKDVGYQGGNTTSGSRLNTSLKDTAAAVNPFTKEFLSDFNASGLADLSNYGVGIENESKQTTPGADNMSFNGGSNRRENTVLIRGLAASTASDYFETGIKIDTYNVERIEQASGPNAILFGLGSPGGLINTTTKRANILRDLDAVRFQVGSNNFKRVEVDHNQVLIPKELAFRINGLYQDSDSWRKYNFDDSKRLAGSVQWRPWANSTLTVNAEIGKMRSSVDRMTNAFNNIALYDAQGAVQKSDSAFVAGIDQPLGINRAVSGTVNANNPYPAAYSRTVYSTDSSNATYSNIFTATNATGRRYLQSSYENMDPALSLNRVGNPLLSESQLPYDINIFGPQSWRSASFNRVTPSFEQRLGQDIVIEVSYNHERYRQSVQTPAQSPTPITLYRDPNTTLPNPNGSATPVANPNVGRYYIETVWGADRGGYNNDVLRGTISWKLDLGKFGQHNLAAMAEYGDLLEYRDSGNEIMVDQNNRPIFDPTTPTSAANRLLRRQYITLGNFDSYVPTGPGDAVTFTSGGNTYHNRMLFNAADDNERVTKSAMIVTQSRFFKDHLIVTAGLRKDILQFISYQAVPYLIGEPSVTSGNEIANSTYSSNTPERENKLRPVTSTYGFVYHINNTISPFYNHANNFGQPALGKLTLSTDGNYGILPPTKGVSDDVGLMLNLLGDKLFIRATAFKTALVDGTPTNYSTPSIISANKSILDGLKTAGYITQAQYDTREFSTAKTIGGQPVGLSDSITKGINLTVNYNPSKSLTLQANYSYSTIERSNIAPELDAWLADSTAFWYGSGSNVGLLTSGNTVYGATIDDNLATLKSFIDGYRDSVKFNYGQRPHKVNGIARYSFKQGKLKGAFIGGGASWQSKAVIGRQVFSVAKDGSTTFGDKIYGPEYFNMDAFIGYKRNLTLGSFKTDFTCQLNVTNLTDEDAVQVLRYNTDQSGYARVTIGNPRLYKLAASFNF